MYLRASVSPWCRAIGFVVTMWCAPWRSWLPAAGAPRRIYCDNGSEFSGRLMDLWAYTNKVVLEFSRPGKPTDNAFIESFNGSLRDECLNVHWFEDLTDADEKMRAWKAEYNESRPHRALNKLTPSEYLALWRQQQQKFALPLG